MNLLLICIGGISTSILERSISLEMKKERLEGKVEAHAYEVLDNCIDEFDVVLCGPQTKAKYPELKKICDEKKVPCGMISPSDYGLSKGENILKQAQNLLINSKR